MNTKHVSFSRFRRMSWNDKVFVSLNTLLLIIVFLVTLYPMLYVLSASFSDPDAVASGEMLLWPIRPSLQAYEYVFSYKEIWIGYANTIFYTVIGTLLNLAVTIPCAYALSRHELVGRNFFMTLFMIVMYFGGGLIPAYLNVRDFGLLDTRWILLITGLVSTYNLIVARTFFLNSIPWELHEAAFIDGCSDMGAFFKIALPLSKPILVVLMLYYGVSHWNSYFEAMIYIRTRKKFPLQVFLKEILTLGQFSASDEGAFMSAEEMVEMAEMADTANMIKFAVIVVATVPMLILYPMVQKHFEKGAMIGSVKG